MMRLAQFVKDAITGRRYRLTKSNNEVHKDTHMRYENDAFARAADEQSRRLFADQLMKSRRARGQSVREMADSKDYMGSDIDSFDRAPRGRRRKDMRESLAQWAGIQSLDDLDDDALFELGDDLTEESRAMLVSGRPSRIRFPGARGDSTLQPFQRQRYTEPTDEDEVELGEGQGEGRSRIGGDRVARRALRQGLDDDSYVTGKSFGYRSRGFTPADLVKSFNVIKRNLQKAMWDEQIDPNILLNFEGASESHLGLDLNSAMRALACVAPEVRARYNIPSISGNQWEELGQIRRAV